MKKALLIISVILIVAGRLAIPTRHNFSLAGSYEAFAHIWIGSVATVAVLVPKQRKSLVGIVTVLSLWELYLVLSDK